MTRKRNGKFDAQTNAPVDEPKREKIEPLAVETLEDATKRLNKHSVPEVSIESGTFKINIKESESTQAYSNDKEPYFFVKVPSLSTALRFYGGVLDESQEQFLEEALGVVKDAQGNKVEPTTPESKKTEEAVSKVLEIINGVLDDSASRARYTKVLNHYSFLTDENIENANASIVRNFMKTQNVGDETALQTLQSFGVVPKDFTLEMFRSNKGKR